MVYFRVDYAIDLPAAKDVLRNDGAILVEVAVCNPGRQRYISFAQSFDPWLTHMVDPVVRGCRDEDFRGWAHISDGDAFWNADYYVAGVMRNYRLDCPMIAHDIHGTIGHDVVLGWTLASAIPQHLARMFREENQIGALLDPDDD